MSRDINVGVMVFKASSNVRAGHARAALYAHVVEGKLTSTAQIAKRVGVSRTTAIARTKRGPYPLTWSNLSLARLPRIKEQA